LFINRRFLFFGIPGYFLELEAKQKFKTGGKYENDHLGAFQLKDGKIVEYTEYFNQVVIAKAFGIKL